MRGLIPLLVALLLGACGPSVSAPEPTADRAAGAPDAPSPTVVALPSPIATATATAAPTATAGASAVPGDKLGSAAADFDCDGRADRLEFFARDTGGPFATTLARLTVASGSASEVTLGFDDGFSPLLGVTDVNGDGCDDAIVTVGHGASTVATGFLVFDDGLRRVEENGKPATFLFAGSVRHGNSIECRRTKDTPEIVARGVSDYSSDYAWDLVEDVHHWYSRSRLELWSTTRSIIAVSVAYAIPADHDRYWGLSCGNVRAPG